MPNNFEQRNSEVHETINDSPNWIVRWGVTIISIILILGVIFILKFKVTIEAKTNQFNISNTEIVISNNVLSSINNHSSVFINDTKIGNVSSVINNGDSLILKMSYLNSDSLFKVKIPVIIVKTELSVGDLINY